MGKSDDKGEPVKTVTIGGKKVEVPIIFVLPEEAGEKEIERYERPKVHIDSKKEGTSLPDSILDAGEGIADKIDSLDLSTPEAETIGSNTDIIQAESKEESLDELTDGKLEEVEKLPFKTPKYTKYPTEMLGEKPDKPIKENPELEKGVFSRGQGGKDTDDLTREIKNPENREDMIDRVAEGNISTLESRAKGEDDEEETPYFDLLSDKPKKKKKKEDVSYRALFDKGYGKAQALRRSVEEQKKRGAKTDDELAAEKEKEIPKGQHGMLNYNYLFDKPDIEEKEKSWEKWLENKSLGALGWGKLNRDGTKKKLRRRQPTLDDYPEDDNGDKKDET